MGENLNYESLSYGNYVIENDSVMFSESIKYDRSDFNKLYVQQVRLPSGKSNIVYILSKTFEDGISLIKNKYFYTPPIFRKVYMPIWSAGYFMGKRYKVSVDTKLKKERDKLIQSEIKKVPVKTRKLPTPFTENIFFMTSDIYQAISPIAARYGAKRVYTEFIPSFVEIIKSLSPSTEKTEDLTSNNRIIIIDADNFKFKSGASLKDNKTNPLYLIYLAYLRTKDLSKLNVDIDFLICQKNMFMKFNPSKLTVDEWGAFRRFLFRLMNVNLDEYTDSLPDHEKAELEETAKDKIIDNVVNNAVSPYVKNVHPSTKIVLQNAVRTKLREEADKKLSIDKEIKLAVKDDNKEEDNISPFNSILKSNPVLNPLSKRQEALFKSVASYNPVVEDEYIDDEDENDWEEDIEDDAKEIMQNDEEVASEVLDEIQDHTAPLKRKNSPINSKRDEKLREAQKKVIVNNETIEQILSRDNTNVPIEETDKSAVMHTSNKNMTKIKFGNFDKTYIDELYTKDLVSCFDMLKDKDSPFFITNIDIRDTSTVMDFKDTWTVTLRDDTNKRHTLKVDIPKFINDKFMLIGGTKYIILKQNFYNPIVKDTPDSCIITTNFNKVTVARRSTKSLSSVEKIFSLIKKTGDNKIFKIGDCSKENLRYISSLEYDELSKRLHSFKSKNCEIYFSREYLKQFDFKSNADEFLIGFEGKDPIIINEDTGLDKKGRTIINIIEEHLPDEYLQKYETIKAPSQSMYVEAKMAGQFVPVIAILIVWIGLSKALDRMGISWKFDNTTRRVPKDSSGKKYIRFANGVLEYQNNTFSELVMNGLSKMHPEKFEFESFENEEGYGEYIASIWGTYNGINELITFYQFLVDPITKDVCKDMMLPDDAPGLLLHATKLLADNAFVSKANDSSYRVRSIEMIPAILYTLLCAQYKAHVKSGRRLPMTLNQRSVIQKLIAEKTVEAYSTLNPVVEVYKTNAISTKGFKGSNSQYSYDEEKRSYDPSAIGKIAMTTSADANVGINRELVIEPTIANARGYRDPVDDIESLEDVNMFSPSEMLTPGTIRGDDPIRSAINQKSCSAKTI